LLHRFDIDSAVSSGAFVTTVTDIAAGGFGLA
jgi:Mg/Co/Ni transporter MgtE